ncbi:MAG: 2-isopropylmalate synthase [Myxococcales bacterium]|nr:2-isopropylmalate synthase [Myxococcales bacterium]
MDTNYVRIFDTTLRDGEQSPGATMTRAEKLLIAESLARLGVDVIEAGFPAASPGDLQAVAAIAESVGQSTETPSGEPPMICGLARAKTSDIDKAWEGVKAAKRPRIHTFLATSDIHLEYKLRMTREQVVTQVREMVGYASKLCPDVEFSPEDAGRSEPAFLYEVLAAAIAAGATTLNIPDTVGYTTPEEFGSLIKNIKENTKGMTDDIIISVHCHNDLGLATANSLSGVLNGARQIEVAVNGIGERAGNTALEEVVMAMHTRAPFYEKTTGIDTTQIMRASKLVSSCTGMQVQPNKAIVGANAFAHEAGIHQDGMLKNESTYEIMRPETVGVAESQLVLGKHSGRHAVKTRLGVLGYHLGDDDLKKAFDRFKDIADKKKNITDADLEALVTDELRHASQLWNLADLQVASGTTDMPTATVRLAGPDGEIHVQAAVGAGPVDAIYKAIDQIMGKHGKLLEFNVQSVTGGIDALGEVTVRVESLQSSDSFLNPQSGADAKRSYIGHGTATDIVVAGAQAYIAALNKLIIAEKREDAANDQAAASDAEKQA